MQNSTKEKEDYLQGQKKGLNSYMLGNIASKPEANKEEKKISINEASIAQAIRIGGASLAGVALGYFLDEMMSRKVMSWIVIGGTVALAYETKIVWEEKFSKKT